MGWWRIVSISLAVLSLGVAYLLYQPYNDEIEQQWELRKMHASLKLRFLWAEIKYRLGYFNERWPFLRVTLKELMSTETDFTGLHISRDVFDGVPVKIYTPEDVTGLVPCLVYLHGGGWSMLDADVYDAPMTNISRSNKMIIVSVNYRLAPENPFPIPLEDCLTATRYVLNHGAKHGIDSKRVAVGGDSSGGNIAAALVSVLRDEKQDPPLKAHINIYGVQQLCDFTLPIFQTRAKYEKYFTFGALYITANYLNLTSDQVLLFSGGDFSTPELRDLCQKYVDLKYLSKDMIFEGYQRGDHVPSNITEDVKVISEKVGNPLISPLLAEDLSGLPNTLVLSVGWDILGDENQIYAGRLKEAGVPVTSVHMKESFHGCFQFFVLGFKSGDRALKIVKDYLKETL